MKAALVQVAAADAAIVAAYLFGSLVHRAAGPLSDVDIGLLVRDGQDRQAICDRTMDALCRRLQTSRVVVVALADAPVPLRYRIVRDGTLVVCRDASLVERFATAAVLHYLDFKPLRDRAFETMRAAILEGR